ncbi:MAG: hypothetical protein HC804_02345 [Anaerolineae bacterium]|nr:hypothetical protein [Anaerolineae bacterium]
MRECARCDGHGRMNTWAQQVDFVRAMPGAASKIMFILFLSGRTLTGKELQFACDMAEATTDKGLAWLEFKGLIQNNGKFNGWSLTAAAYQLPLPFAQLETRHQNALPALHGAATSPKDGNGKSSGNGENPKKRGFLSSSSSLISDPEKEKEEEEETRENPKIYGFLDDDGQTAVRQMLIDAGIGTRSRKLRELLAADLAPEFVAAHIHIWRRRHEPVSYLITRLQDGDEPPVCSCPECQPRRAIPADLVGIIKR